MEWGYSSWLCLSVCLSVVTTNNAIIPNNVTTSDNICSSVCLSVCLCEWLSSSHLLECWTCVNQITRSNLGHGYFESRPTQPSIPLGSVNEYWLCYWGNGQLVGESGPPSTTFANSVPMKWRRSPVNQQYTVRCIAGSRDFISLSVWYVKTDELLITKRGMAMILSPEGHRSRSQG